MRKSSQFRSSLAGFFNNQTLQWLVCLGFVFVASLLQMAPNALVIAGAKPMLLILCVACIALFTGPLCGGVMGAVSGFLWDIFTDRLMGSTALLLLFFGTVIGILSWLVLRNNFITGMLVCAAAILLFVVADWAIHYVLFEKDNPWLMLTSVYGPNALYSLLVSPVIYAIFYFCIRKIRED